MFERVLFIWEELFRLRLLPVFWKRKRHALSWLPLGRAQCPLQCGNRFSLGARKAMQSYNDMSWFSSATAFHSTRPCDKFMMSVFPLAASRVPLMCKKVPSIVARHAMREWLTCAGQVLRQDWGLKKSSALTQSADCSTCVKITGKFGRGVEWISRSAITGIAISPIICDLALMFQQIPVFRGSHFLNAGYSRNAQMCRQISLLFSNNPGSIVPKLSGKVSFLRSFESKCPSIVGIFFLVRSISRLMTQDDLKGALPVFRCEKARLVTLLEMDSPMYAIDDKAQFYSIIATDLFHENSRFMLLIRSFVK